MSIQAQTTVKARAFASLTVMPDFEVLPNASKNHCFGSARVDVLLLFSKEMFNPFLEILNDSPRVLEF